MSEAKTAHSSLLRRDPAATMRPAAWQLIAVAIAFFALGAVLSYQAGARRAPRYEFRMSSSGIPLRLDTVTGKIEVVLPEPLPAPAGK